MRQPLPIPLGLALMLGTLSATLITLLSGLAEGWLGVLIIASLSVGITLGIAWAMGRLEGRFQDRISADTALHWEVLINGVTVGSVSDTEYAQIQQAAFRDERLGMSQLLNAGHVMIVGASRLMVAIPLQFFWLAALYALYDAAGFLAMIAQLQAAGPETLVYTFQHLMTILLLIGTLWLGLSALTGSRMGFRNHYRERVAQLLRQRFDVVAEGDVILVPAMLGTAKLAPASRALETP